MSAGSLPSPRRRFETRTSEATRAGGPASRSTSGRPPEEEIGSLEQPEGIANHFSEPRYGGICDRCKCDLFAHEDGTLRCRNWACVFSPAAHGMPHPCGNSVNHGGFCA